MPVSQVCSQWTIDPSTGAYICLQLVETANQVFIDIDSISKAFGAGFGIVVLAGAAGAGVGALFRLLK